jgi:hypothetical protein
VNPVQYSDSGTIQWLCQNAALRQCKDFDPPASLLQRLGKQHKLALRAAEIERPDNKKHAATTPSHERFRGHGSALSFFSVSHRNAFSQRHPPAARTRQVPLATGTGHLQVRWDFTMVTSRPN